MKTFKLTYEVRVYKTMEIEIDANTEDEAKVLLLENPDSNIIMGDTIPDRWSQDIEIDITKCEMTYDDEGERDQFIEEGLGRDISSN